MAVNYAAWPTASDVLDRLASAGVTPRGDTAAVQNRIAAIVRAIADQVGNRTHRQFVADTEPTSHTYDGSGTPELEIDPILTVTEVQIAGGFGIPSYLYDLSSVQTIGEQGKPQTRLTVGRGSLPAFASAAILTPTYYLFPAGRQNIVVTGLFGYAATIPADLWEAVCGEVAVRLAREILFVSAGRVSQARFGDESKTFKLPEAEATGWHAQFEQALSDYRRPAGAALRKRRSPMV